jgi:predicted dehydrogenase
MSAKKLKVALVGCGQIADAHVQEARRVDCAEVVAVCDQHRDLAEQLAARFQVPQVFDNLERLLRDVGPDVLHVTTPPLTHRPIALQALAAGVNVYVEKPFTIDAAEADEVLAAARANRRLVCVGHDQLFDPAWEDARARFQAGELGRVVHVDTVQGYDLSGPFGKVLSADPNHWVHGLPGGVFQNTISHAMYKITDFLADERPRVWATWFAPQPGTSFPTDLRVMLQGRETTATLLFASQARPVQRVTRLYGTRECLEIDLEARSLRRIGPATMPGPFAKLQLPYRDLCEAARALGKNLYRFLRSDLHYFEGMRRLFSRFYEAILEGGEPPIPYGEIRRVTAMMDDIFESCRAEADREAVPVA